MKYFLLSALFIFSINFYAQENINEDIDQTKKESNVNYNPLDELLVGDDYIKNKLTELSKLRMENDMLSKLIEERKSTGNRKLLLKSEVKSPENIDESENRDNETKEAKTSELLLKTTEAENKRRNLINENNDKRRDFAEKQKELYKSKKELEIKERELEKELEKELRIERAKNEKLKQLEKSLSLN